MVSQDSGGHGLNTHRQRSPVDLDAVAKFDALTHVSEFIVDSDTALDDELFHL
jgi:hypothetical protein